MTEPTLFIYKIQPVRLEMLTEGFTTEEDQIISEHFDYLKALTDKGMVFLAGRTLNTDPSSFGIVIFNVDSEQEARKLMLKDPAVKKQVMRSELYPFCTSLLGVIPKI
jgi:uncharacterized protein YciI